MRVLIIIIILMLIGFAGYKYFILKKDNSSGREKDKGELSINITWGENSDKKETSIDTSTRSGRDGKECRESKRKYRINGTIQRSLASIQTDSEMEINNVPESKSETALPEKKELHMTKEELMPAIKKEYKIIYARNKKIYCSIKDFYGTDITKLELNPGLEQEHARIISEKSSLCTKLKDARYKYHIALGKYKKAGSQLRTRRKKSERIGWRWASDDPKTIYPISSLPSRRHKPVKYIYPDDTRGAEAQKEFEAEYESAKKEYEDIKKKYDIACSEYKKSLTGYLNFLKEELVENKGKMSRLKKAYKELENSTREYSNISEILENAPSG